jgi:hypothetical protein
VNGDGYSDVVVGSNRFDSGQVNEGRAFAYRDLRSGSSNTAVLEPGRAGAGLRFERIYPNPSRSQSVVRYVLPQAGAMRLTIHDVRGRRVALLADRFEEAGDHSVSWEGRDPQGATVPAGVYWARLESGGGSVARKIVRR